MAAFSSEQIIDLIFAPVHPLTAPLNFSHPKPGITDFLFRCQKIIRQPRRTAAPESR